MKLNLNTIFILIWFILSWGTIIMALTGEVMNQIILKAVIPLLFFIVFFLEKFKLKFNLSLIAFIVFLLWAALSVFYTVNMELTLKYLQQVLGNVLLWYLTFRLLSNFQNKKTFFLILGLAFLLHAFLGLVTPAENELSNRMKGIFTNANALGFAMWYGIIIFLYFYITSRIKMQKLIISGIVIFLIGILLYTGSRKSFSAALISISIVFIYTNIRHFKRVLLFTPIIIFVYIFFTNTILSETPLGERLDPEYVERSAEFRAELVTEGITFFIDHPFMGIGLGSFTSYATSGKMSHNDYIEVLASTGIIGFLTYMLIFFIFFKQAKVLLRYKETYHW